MPSVIHPRGDEAVIRVLQKVLLMLRSVPSDEAGFLSDEANADAFVSSHRYRKIFTPILV